MRPRRKSDRMACKHCPACEEQVPVACKFCPCGHQFPTRSKTKQKKEDEKQSTRDDHSGPESMGPSEKSNASEGAELSSKRRTVRTKRFRPDFFTPMDDQVAKRKPKEQTSEKGTDKAKRRRNRSKSSNASKEETPKQVTPSTPDDDLFVNLSAEKALQYSVILAELNRKLNTQHFKPL